MTDFSQSNLDNIPTTACLISLASNYQPEYYLSQALLAFKQEFLLEKFVISDTIISQDKQAWQNSLSYYNQMLMLYFQQPISLAELTQITKQIEISLDRKKFDKPRVTLDIDIIAFSSEKLISKGIDLDIALLDYHETSLNQETTLSWYKILRRFPLASYEVLGLENIVKKNKNFYPLVRQLII